eukprot:7385188-Prymnesium_polylepis.3
MRATAMGRPTESMRTGEGQQRWSAATPTRGAAVALVGQRRRRATRSGRAARPRRGIPCRTRRHAARAAASPRGASAAAHSAPG